jgi:MSHA biogenesis protein MshQ
MNGTKALVLATATAVAVMALVSTAHAQIAFRNSSSAFIAGGGGTPVAPTFRSSSSAVLKTGPTRFYHVSLTPDVDPPIQGTWTGGTSTLTALGLSRALQCYCASTPSGAATATATTNGTYVVLKMVSEPLPSAVTISGTLNWALGAGETSTGLNAYTKIHAYVLRGSSTLIGTLLNNYAESATATPAGTEFPGTVGALGPAGGTAKALTQVTAQAGDRIVFELGYTKFSTRTDTGRIYYAGNIASDMVVGGSGTQVGWFEFSQDLFGSTISKPNGTIAGDVMIAAISVRPNTATITAPQGWTLVNRIDNTTASLAIYRRTADANDASVYSYAWGTSGATSAIGNIRSFSGVDTANPNLIDVQNGQTTVGTGGSHATPDVTTTVANTLLVATFAAAGGSLNWNLVPTGMSENFDVATLGNSTGTTMAGDTAVQATAGATGTKSAGLTNSVVYPGTTHILALRGIGGGGSTTLTITKPAGVVQNDVMIASISVGPSTATIGAPGWTLVRRMDNTNGTSNSLAVYSKVAGASEPASYDWTLGAGHTGAAGSIMAFAGADPVIEAENGQTTASGTSHATPTVATAYANTMLVASYGIGATSTWLPPVGMTETVDAQGGSQALEVSYVPQAAIAGSISKTATSSGTGTGNAHILALRRVTGAFNAFDTATALGALSGNIKTKVAGTSVTLATIALNPPKTAVATTFLGTVKVDVLDASDNSGVLDANTKCNSTWTVLQPLPDITFGVADNGRKNVSFTVANSYRNVRLKLSYPASAPDTFACSSDNFAIRPNAFTNVLFTDGNPNNAGTTNTLNNLTVPGGTIHKAGRPFTVQATAVNGAATPATTTNYAGTATTTITNCVGSNACVASPAGTLTLGGSFVAGQLSSDLATYNNVGAVAVTLVDSTFAAVDAADGSTATEMNISSSPVNVGRFVPHHFDVQYNTPTLGTACSAGSFTYVGQPFNYTVAPVITVTAQTFDNVTTTNYTGALWQITNASLTGKTYGAAGGYLVNTTGITGTDPVIADSGNGTGTLTFTSGTGLFLTRPSSAVAPFNAELSLAINVIDTDGIAYISNPATFGQATAGNGIAFSSGKEMRFGRLAFRNANGSQLVPLPVRVEAQYYAYTNPPTNNVLGFITNTADTCTSIANTDVQMSTFTANLSACETAISGAGTLSSGRKTLLLAAPGNANNGSVLLTANLGVASGTTCTSVGAATVSATAANKAYLQGNWASSTVYTSDPSARATFGTVKGADEVIYMRENF